MASPMVDERAPADWLEDRVEDGVEDRLDDRGDGHLQRASGEMRAEDRRRHVRVPVGLPVQIRIGGDDGAAITVELVDLAEGGVRFRFLEAGEARLEQRAAFTFLLPGQESCSAEGRVVRVHAGGEFIVVLDRSNASFRDFVGSLA